jgi:hypothetical protein
MDAFNVWAGSCSHVHTDLAELDRESLAEPIRQSEGRTDAPGFDWDVFLHLGDTSGSQRPPDEEHGEEVVRQFDALEEHRREQVYNLAGNHDATTPEQETQWWFRRYLDPTGEHTEHSGVDPEKRPYAVEGTWERYAFEVGNVRFLMLSDRNDGGPPDGRRMVGEDGAGGYPAGKVTRETFEWWREQVESHQDKILVTCHHHMLRDTTVASGPWEGITGHYHGYMADGAPEGAGYLYFVGDEPDAGAFESYLTDNPGAIDLWLGGHTHALPDDDYGQKTHVEREYDVTFVNVSPMTADHGTHTRGLSYVPLTRLLTFEPGERLARLRCYLHTEDYDDVGWYAPADRRLPLRHAFEPPA